MPEHSTPPPPSRGAAPSPRPRSGDIGDADRAEDARAQTAALAAQQLQQMLVQAAERARAAAALRAANGTRSLHLNPAPPPSALPYTPPAAGPPTEPAWQRSLAALARHEVRLANELDRAPVGGNRTQLLIDGAQAYAAMFAAIQSARDHINIESYIIEAEGPGEALANLLCRKRAQGVRVNLIYDSWGSWQTSSRYFARLREAGVALCEFNPILPWRRWLRPLAAPPLARSLAGSFNLRDHRKLTVIDGRIAFTGGVNIASVYASGSAAGPIAPHAERKGQERSRSQDPNEAHWRDTHVRIDGPVVAQLQQLFLDQWRMQTGQAAQPAHYYPTLAPAGPERIAVAARGAGERRGRFYRALLAAIDESRSRIYITVGYFVPTRRLLRALIAAAERGVDVRLVLPGFSDVPAAVHAARSQYGRLLAAGARIYEHCDALLHAKTTVIDGAWASIGSHNMDWRSFVHNAECNIVVLNTAFARHLEQLFDTDIVACREVTLPDWDRRGRLLRIKEWLALQVEYLL